MPTVNMIDVSKKTLHKYAGGGAGPPDRKTCCCGPPNKEAIEKVCKEAAEMEVQRQMVNALSLSAAAKANGKAALSKVHVKQEKKHTKERSKNVELESALAGLKNKHAVKEHMPHVVHLPSHRTLESSLKGIGK